MCVYVCEGECRCMVVCVCVRERQKRLLVLPSEDRHTPRASAQLYIPNSELETLATGTHWLTAPKCFFGVSLKSVLLMPPSVT